MDIKKRRGRSGSWVARRLMQRGSAVKMPQLFFGTPNGGLCDLCKSLYTASVKLGAPIADLENIINECILIFKGGGARVVLVLDASEATNQWAGSGRSEVSL